VTHPTFATSDRLRRACATRSALTDGVFTSACFEIARDMPPCGECLRDVGVEPGDEYDARIEGA